VYNEKKIYIYYKRININDNTFRQKHSIKYNYKDDNKMTIKVLYVKLMYAHNCSSRIDHFV